MKLRRTFCSGVLLVLCMLVVSCGSQATVDKATQSTTKEEDKRSLEEKNDYILPNFENYSSMSSQQILDSINDSNLFTGFTCYRYSKHLSSKDSGYQRTHLVVLSEDYWLYQKDTHVVYYFRRECNVFTTTVISSNMIMQVDSTGKPLLYSDSMK